MGKKEKKNFFSDGKSNKLIKVGVPWQLTTYIKTTYQKKLSDIELDIQYWTNV